MSLLRALLTAIRLSIRKLDHREADFTNMNSFSKTLKMFSRYFLHVQRGVNSETT